MLDTMPLQEASFFCLHFVRLKMYILHVRDEWIYYIEGGISLRLYVYTGKERLKRGRLAPK